MTDPGQFVSAGRQLALGGWLIRSAGLTSSALVRCDLVEEAPQELPQLRRPAVIPDASFGSVLGVLERR